MTCCTAFLVLHWKQNLKALEYGFRAFRSTADLLMILSVHACACMCLCACACVHACVGDIVVVCETEEKQNELKNLVTTKDERIVMHIPAEKRASIIIVGLQQEYKKYDIIDMLILQNDFIKGFANSNDIRKHIEIFAVQLLKNHPERF